MINLRSFCSSFMLPSGGRLWTSTRQTGNKPVVLLVHGAYHGAWCYAKWMHDLLQEGYQVAAVDWPGHGGLPAPTGYENLDIPYFAKVVGECIDQLPARPIVIGHSLGALVLAVAAERRDITGMALLAPSPPGNMPGVAAVSELPTGKPYPPPSLERFRDIYMGGAENAEIWLPSLCSESPCALNDRYNLRISVNPRPTEGLVLEAGLEDPLRHPLGQDEAVAAFFGYEYHHLPHAPHCMMLHDPGNAAYKALSNWLRRLWIKSEQEGSALV
ncbi:alpha/beta hydrolase [Thalassospira marina]|nr:alpha/beta hydrolase [Thalassospira marina]